MFKPKILVLLAGISVLLTLIHVFHVISANNNVNELPCPVKDSVNITGYRKFPNESYSYEGLIIPPNLWGVSAKTTDDFSVEIPADPHVRGCVCKLRPCVKFCCPTTQIFNNQTCKAIKGNATLPTLMHVTTNSGEIREVDLTKKFAIQYGLPCLNAMYQLLPHLNEFDSFILFENGTLLTENTIYMSKHKFCLNAYSAPNATYALSPVNCGEFVENTISPPKETINIFNKYTMLFSVPFMILTIIVYMVEPELNNFHNKSVCCYLLGLCFGYTILCALQFIDYISPLPCAVLGYLAYFWLMSSFFWLSAISFDLFKTFGTYMKNYEKKRFITFCTYVWSLALIFLCSTYAADQFSFIPNYLKPGIGRKDYCWFDASVGWSAMIYFYGPNIIIIIFNIVMFVLTALRIHTTKKKCSSAMKITDSQKNYSNERYRFSIFLRLFILMGVTWSMDIISYLVESNSSWQIMFYITDFVNAFQGFIIFVLFVLTKPSLKKRYCPIRFSQPERQGTSKMQFPQTKTEMLDIEPDKSAMDKILKIQN